MRVTAIIPTYNRAHLVSRAIESVLAQTYPDIELIVVDDGSTDATEGVVGTYQGGTRAVHYLKKPNGGCASARNRGLELAGGELIGFLDSDDEWLPGALESLVASLMGANADFVYSPAIEVGMNGERFTTYPAAEGKPEEFAVEHFMTAQARSCSTLYRRRVFAKVRFDETTRHNEDSDFLQRVAMSFKAAYSPAPTGVVHHHGANKSGNRVELYRAVLKSTDAIVRDHPDFARELGGRAAERRGEIRRHLVKALLLEGNVAGARAEAAGDRFGSEIDWLLRLGWSFPLRWRAGWIEARAWFQQRVASAVAGLRRRTRA